MAIAALAKTEGQFILISGTQQDYVDRLEGTFRLSDTPKFDYCVELDSDRTQQQREISKALAENFSLNEIDRFVETACTRYQWGNQVFGFICRSLIEQQKLDDVFYLITKYHSQFSIVNASCDLCQRYVETDQFPKALQAAEFAPDCFSAIFDCAFSKNKLEHAVAAAPRIQYSLIRKIALTKLTFLEEPQRLRTAIQEILNERTQNVIPKDPELLDE